MKTINIDNTTPCNVTGALIWESRDYVVHQNVYSMSNAPVYSYLVYKRGVLVSRFLTKSKSVKYILHLSRRIGI